jgi:hypothetical protein
MRATLKIVINRESADRAIVRAKFKNKFYTGEIAYIPLGRKIVDIKYIGRGCFFVPHMYKITKAASILGIDQRVVLKVFVDV